MIDRRRDLHVAIQDSMEWLDYHLHECGVRGYHELLEALLDPAHPEHESLSRWIPNNWGPELFRPDKVLFDNPRRRWEHAFLSEGSLKAR